MKVFVPVIAFFLVFLAGCTTGTSRPAGVVVEDGRPVYGEPSTTTTTKPASPPPVSSDAPYADLVKRAGEARDTGDYDQALALLERAQRIEPASADIYLALAETHRARGDQAQARSTAERGLLYCASRSQCEALRFYTR